MLGNVCLNDLQPGVVQTDAWETNVEKLAVSLSRSCACVLSLPRNQWAAPFAALQVLSEQSGVAWMNSSCVEAEEKPGSRAIHFRASGVANTGSGAPNVLEMLYGLLDTTTRAVMHALCRSRLLRLRSDTFDGVLDDLPLPRTQQGSSVLSVQTYVDNFQESCTAQGHIFIDPQEETSDSGLLTIIIPQEAHDPEMGPLSVLQVKDAAGNWEEVEVKEGEAVVLLGRTTKHATAGILGPATYRVAGDPYGTKNGHSRRLLRFELRPRPSAVLDFTQQLAEAGHQVPLKYAAPVSVRSLMEHFEVLMSPGKDVHTPRNMEGVAAHTAWDLATAKKQRKRSSEAAGLFGDEGGEADPVTRSGNVHRTSAGGLVNQHRPSRFKQQARSASGAAAAGEAAGGSGAAPMEGSIGDSGNGNGRPAGGSMDSAGPQQHPQQPSTAGGDAGSGRGSLCDAMGRRQGVHEATGAAKALYYVRGHTCTVMDGCLLDEPASCIALCVRSFTGLERWFYCNRSLACGRVFETYCDRMGVNLGAVKFLYKGERIFGADTPAALQVEDGEEFTAVPESSDRLQQAQELGPLYATLFDTKPPGSDSPI
ncbi:hypothetical protein N2152v2_002985 [Parachlorella kessleri]